MLNYQRVSVGIIDSAGPAPLRCDSQRSSLGEHEFGQLGWCHVLSSQWSGGQGRRDDGWVRPETWETWETVSSVAELFILSQLFSSRSQNHQVPSRSDSAVQSDHEKLRCPLDAWTKNWKGPPSLIMTLVSSPDFTNEGSPDDVAVE